MNTRQSVETYVRRVADIDPLNVMEYGGKAAGLARMTHAHIPIPPAIVIGTRGYHSFVDSGGRIIPAIAEEIRTGVAQLERETGKQFAAGMPPLLVSVRSGAAVSMPGMMDTILNLGLTAQSAFEFSTFSGKPDFVIDTWTRFWRMYVETALDLDESALDEDIAFALEEAKAAPSRQTFDALELAILDHIRSMGCAVSADPNDQLVETVAAVFRSWNSPRAKAYRAHHRIADDMGTAVTIQAMAFGNADSNSGTGVAFTRDPNDGSKTLYGEYLTGHQGEDLVAGTHTPMKLSDAAMPEALVQSLATHGATLETIYRDAVDIEFTVESGRLHFLQVRAAKRTAAAAIRIATDLVREGLISAQEGVRRASPDQVLALLKPNFDPAVLAAAPLLATGLGSSPGQSCGNAVLDSDRAAEAAAKGEQVILLRPITSPQDIRGMLAANGVVTARGGALSHAAVVSRALDKPCIVGCETIEVDPERRIFSIGGRIFPEGTPVSIDGATGKVYAGIVPMTDGTGGGLALAAYLDMADIVSGADVWCGPRSEVEIENWEFDRSRGVALVGLTDLVRSRGRLKEFTALIAEMAHDHDDNARGGIAEIVTDSTHALLARSGGQPVHIRLPQLGSERARQLLPNWEELAAVQFLPLGNLPLLRAMLAGLAAARSRCGHGDLSAFAGGISSLSEYSGFQREVAAHPGIRAGLLVQNLAMFKSMLDGPDLSGDVWIDVNEIIRTVHGLPSHLQQMSSVLDQYGDGGVPQNNPFRQPAGFLAASLVEGGRKSGPTLGVLDGQALSDELLLMLYNAGYRRFSTSLAGRNAVRLKLATNERI